MKGVRRYRRSACALGLLLASVLPVAAAEKCGTVAGDEADLATAWQRLEATCGCSPARTESWKPEFRSFVSCARTVATQAVVDETIRAKCRSTLLSGAKKSTCSRPPEWTTCCYTTRKGKQSCKARRTEELCAETPNKFAELGETDTCLDACANASGPTCWEDVECDDADPCTIDWCESSDGCVHVDVPGCTPGGSDDGGTSCTGNGTPTHGLAAVEQQLFDLVNAYRASQGEPPVTTCSALNRSAQDHANDMRNRGYYAHVGPGGTEFWERACEAGYTAGCGPLTWMGEIIAASDATAQGILDQWLNSPGHDFIMGSSNYTVAGIGHACGGPFGHYWVMDFGGANEPSCN